MFFVTDDFFLDMISYLLASLYILYLLCNIKPSCCISFTLQHTFLAFIMRSNVRILFYDDDWLQVIKVAMHDTGLLKRMAKIGGY